MTNFAPLVNPLEYPAGCTPGFDPTHVASMRIVPGHGFSAVLNAKGYAFSMLTGKAPSSIYGSPVGSTDGNIGPVFMGANSNRGLEFNGQSTESLSAGTVACITKLPATGVGGAIFVNNNGGSSWFGLGVNSSPRFHLVGDAGAPSTIPLSLNVPYFSVISTQGSGAPIYYLVLNLTTGAIRTETVTSTASVSASNGTYIIGTGATPPFYETKANTHAVMFSSRLMSMSEMWLWAQDPWSFWYPRTPLQQPNDRTIFNPGTNAFRLRFRVSNTP